MENQKALIRNIERADVQDVAKHKYAEILIKNFNNVEVRRYLQGKYKSTGDYFYMGLLKTNIQ